MDGTEQAETKRDRVRRLLLTPMAQLGFRFPKGISAEEGQRKLDRIADDLAYMAEDRLRERMLPTLRTKGQGSARNFWPDHATFIAYAQIAQPRPLSEMPGIASWFGSVAGQQALDGGRLVAEFRFWQEKNRPPQGEAEKRRVAAQGLEDESRAMRIRERLGHNLAVDAIDRGWLVEFNACEARAMALVDARRGAVA
ncbi:hypothetical protein DL237_10010 [Pseudooceanicola sediminis]|uniref:Uncharacterized protein n=1 Tax=Pseudooceanicola sediminis TaxID=2211117 RepID=A0A399J0R1_9RHOB|nr:hypothetical protein [Pseudooceanicola sediminis]RII39003.1 hypothetical protein DL237_10010 [Pseudooceanicola sediminis]|tara:strand:- start:15085 stop:15675 length:591 start_codon:yes stop_codon:yes gene_type:complete